MTPRFGRRAGTSHGRGKRGKPTPPSTVRCWCGRLGMVPYHAPSFRCCRNRRRPTPAWTGPSLVESPEFKAFAKQRQEERERRKAQEKV